MPLLGLIATDEMLALTTSDLNHDTKQSGFS